MKKMLLGLAAAVALSGLANAAEAQFAPTSPLSLEVRGGAAVPLGDMADAVNSGYTLGANAQFAVTPMVALYAGGTFNSFGFGSGTGASFEAAGLDLGAKASFGTGELMPFVRGGLAYYRGALRADGDRLTGDWEAGFDVGAGFDYALGPRISVTPAVSFTSLPDDTRFIKLDVGMRFRM